MKKEHLKDYVLFLSHFSHCSSVSLLIPQRSLCIFFFFFSFLFHFLSFLQSVCVHSFTYCAHTQIPPSPRLIFLYS